MLGSSRAATNMAHVFISVSLPADQLHNRGLQKGCFGPPPVGFRVGSAKFTVGGHRRHLENHITNAEDSARHVQMGDRRGLPRFTSVAGLLSHFWTGLSRTEGVFQNSSFNCGFKSHFKRLQMYVQYVCIRQVCARCRYELFRYLTYTWSTADALRAATVFLCLPNLTAVIALILARIATLKIQTVDRFDSSLLVIKPSPLYRPIQKTLNTTKMEPKTVARWPYHCRIGFLAREFQSLVSVESIFIFFVPCLYAQSDAFSKAAQNNTRCPVLICSSIDTFSSFTGEEVWRMFFWDRLTAQIMYNYNFVTRYNIVRLFSIVETVALNPNSNPILGCCWKVSLHSCQVGWKFFLSMLA